MEGMVKGGGGDVVVQWVSMDGSWGAQRIVCEAKTVPSEDEGARVSMPVTLRHLNKAFIPSTWKAAHWTGWVPMGLTLHDDSS